MAKIKDFIRSIPNGTGVNGVSVTVKKHVDDTTVDTLTSDSSGEFAYEADGSPGPIYVSAATGDRTRVRSGQATGQIGTWFGADVPVALRALGDGVIEDYTDPAVTAGNMAVSAGTGLQVLVGEGAALIDGHVYRCTASTALAIGANSSGSTRVDRIVVRFTREGQSEEGKCVLAVSAGTPGNGAPALTQSSATWELSLATVSVADGAASITGGNITDTRTYVLADTAGTGPITVTSTTTTAAVIEQAGGTDLFVADTTNLAVHIKNSGKAIIYSDNGVTEKFKVDGANGNTTVAGTLAVTGASTLTGNVTIGGRIIGETTILPIIIDGGGSAITTGVKLDLPVPYNGTITGWDIVADASGSIVVDLWKDTYANYPATVADTITGANKPTLSSATKNTASGLSWAVTQGDLIRVNVDSASTVTRVMVALKVTKA